MTARVLTGSKHEIAEKVADLVGDVREAIVFVEEASPPPTDLGDIFAEMDAFTVRQAGVDDARESLYQREAGE